MSIFYKGKRSDNLLLILLLVVLVLPFLSAIYLLDSGLVAQSRLISRQKTGVEYIALLRRVLEHVQQHRGMAYARRNGADKFASRLSELGAKLDREIQELEHRYTQFDIPQRAERKSMFWYDQWVNLKQNRNQMTDEDNFDAHSILIGEYLATLRDVADAFNLIQDDDLETHYLLESIIQLPAQLENIARLRGVGAGFAARGKVGTKEKEMLLSLGQLVSQDMEMLNRNMSVLFRGDRMQGSRMQALLEHGLSDASDFLMLTYRKLIEPDSPKINTAQYFSSGTKALNRFYALFDGVYDELQGLLTEQISRVQQKRILLLASSLLAVACMLLIYYLFLRQQKIRQQLLQDIQQEKERLSLITRGTRDGIWDWNLLQDQIYFSSRWKNMLGYEDEEIENNFMSFQGLLHPDDLGLALDAWTGCVEGERETFEVEYRMKTKQGGYCWIQARGLVLLDKQGNPVRMAGSHTDITRQKQNFAELESMNRELEQFAYVTSHDLKAPLRAIANLSSWIEEDLNDVMTEETRKQMELLRGRVKRMESLINGILQYSRAGRVDMEVEMVDVSELLSEIIEGFEYPDDFQFDIAAEMPVIETARVPFSQVFSNLISNAIKYHEGTGGRVAISMKDMGEYYEFSVADNGPGIAPEYHERIFKIFQTLQARDKLESTGVGLTLVKKIVEELGGEISVESEEGRGATFRFTVLKKAETSVAGEDVPVMKSA